MEPGEVARAEHCIPCWQGHCPVHRWSSVEFGMTTVHLGEARVTIRVQVDVRDPSGLGPNDPAIMQRAEIWGRGDLNRMQARAWPHQRQPERRRSEYEGRWADGPGDPQ